MQYKVVMELHFIITVWSFYVPACVANCKKCDSAAQCTTCNNGFFAKTDKSGCDGQFTSV